MADMYPVAGMKLYIGNAPMASKADDFVASDFDGVSWTLIDGWKEMGALGDNAALITDQLINRGRDAKQKGTANAGSMQNSFTVISDDPGQLALIAAAAPSNKSNYPFKVEGNESGVSQKSRRMFIGLVMGAPEAGGGANTMRTLNSTVEINSNIVPVAAVA